MKISPPRREPSFLRLSAGNVIQNENRNEAGTASGTAPRESPPAIISDAFPFVLGLFYKDGRARLFIRAGFAAGLLLVAFVSFLAYHNTAQLVAVEVQIGRSYALRDQIYVVRSAQRRTFFSLQKYLSTANEDDYAVFQKNAKSARTEVNILRQRASESEAIQHEDSKRVNYFVDLETGALQEAAAKHRQLGSPSARLERLPKAAGFSLTTILRDNESATLLLDRMDAREAFAAATKKAVTRQICDQTLQVTGLGGAVTLGVVLLAFFVVERDLTRRSRTESALRERDGDTSQLLQKLGESEERFRIVADTAPVMLFVTDETGAATYLSRPWLEFRGRSESDELGFSWVEGIPEQEREVAVQNVRDAHRRCVPLRMEYRSRRHDGALRWLLASAVPRYVNKQYVGHIGSAVDITEIKQAEQEMHLLVERQQKSETRLRQITRQANCLLWEAQVNERVVDPQVGGTPTHLWHSRENNTVLNWQLSVLDEAEAHQWLPVAWGAGQSFAEAFDHARHPEDRAMLDQVSSAAIRDGKTDYQNEFRCRFADGNERWLAEDVRIERINTGNGVNALGRWRLVGICTDITDRKRQEDNLTRLTVELQRSNEALQDFASIASHDLREPLRKIQMFGGMLQKNVTQSGDATAERNLERVLAAATRMDALVRDLLAYSRVTSKAAPLALVDLNQVVSEVIGDLEAPIVETGGVVGFDGLPRLRADALQMRQLFQNLISNALKFHKPGEPPLVLVQGKREMMDGVLNLVISVSDNGVGFEEEYAERIFNIFERLDRAREGYAGTGVGLAICRKIVQRHGGTITAQSQPGYGSSFTVRLPVPTEKAA